jgi:hypothetical protein
MDHPLFGVGLDQSMAVLVVIESSTGEFSGEGVAMCRPCG